MFAFNSKISNLEINTDDISEMLVETKMVFLGQYILILLEEIIKGIRKKGELGNVTETFIRIVLISIHH